MEKNVETFVNNRRSEGAQLLGSIEQDRAASKSQQAELERERLQGLMDRMAIGNSSSSSPQPSTTSRPNIPKPLFQPGNAPQYAQTGFSSQYQMPNSPPPGQTAHHQQQPYGQQPGTPGYYNPSALGRIAGPTSPQPHVTSFGINAMRPGPASPPPTTTSFGAQVMRPGPTSPPPTQTTFSQPPNQFSTYGNPAGQPQPGYVPPGFVPPPPPPGPPPLGPQQTYHLGGDSSGFYDQQGRPSSGAQQPQQHGQADPWAGLSAWK